MATFINVQCNILCALDDANICAVILLDLSFAFHTAGYQIMLNCNAHQK